MAGEQTAQGPPAPGPDQGRGRVFLDALAGLAPASFATVMSTGIVAVGLHTAGCAAPALALTLIGVLLWAVNLALLLLRIVFRPRAVLDDLASQGRGPGFLTLVAGTNVLGSCCALILGRPEAARALFLLGAGLWPPLLLLALFCLFVTRRKPPLEQGINGAWLLMTVSTQSVVVLGALGWGPRLGDPAVLALGVVFLLGVALYFLIMPLILHRLFFNTLAPEDLNATFWINAGAMSISCLAATKLAPLLAARPALAELAPVVKALGLGAWGLASLWMPLLTLLGLWRHLARHYPFKYGVEYWSMVFPLGMYTACTQSLGAIYPYGFDRLALFWMWVAALAWLAVFAGLCHYCARLLVRIFRA